MKLYKFKSIRTRLTYWIFLFALIPLLITMTITYFQSANNIEVEALDKLTAIRGLKVQQVESWLDNRLGDLQVMSEDFEIRNLEYLFVKKSKSPEDFDKLDAAKNLLNRYLRNFNDYTEIFIIDANTGLVELSTNPDMESMNKFHNSFFNVPLETGEKYIKDIYYSETLGKPEMTFSMPIFCLTHKTHIIGILVVRINLYESLYKLLLNRTGLGETGETLIINKDVVALNELRWYENAPLNLQINAEPAINASQGKTGITVTTDYRGEDILAAYTYLPETSWGFVCKQDLRELNAPIRKMTVNFVFIFGVITIIIFFISLYISKSISKPIINMSLVSQKLEAGNLSERINTNDEDELGSLAKSLNSMADAIESRIEIQQGVSAISKTMIDQTTMQEFGSELLKQLMKITVANMSTFYIINEATSEYEHFFSVGANKELLKPFNVENPEGEVGNALSTKSIYYLRDIPEDTIFKYRTTAGEVIPKEIITIPIVVEDSVVALISLVSIQKFSNECFEILKNSWTNINTSYSNLVAGERTRVLAEHLSRINQQLEAQSEELQDQAEELQDQTAELQHSSEELQEQNIELEAQRKQVEASNKLKSEFLSNMSHELRTPLNSIMGLSQVLMMQAKNKLSDVENNHLAIIERNGKRLLTLINDILDLSKIEAGKIEMETEFISLAYLLQTIKENMYVFSEPKGLEINLTVAENLPAIESDETKLYQALTNIVGNAVKFTEKGSIDITVINNPENVFIEVKDSGIGIPEEELPYIFDQFRQADGSSIRQYEGTGLGLAIANKMITLLGGNISVQSTLGKGSVFKITLPLKWNDDISSTRSNSFGNLPVQSTGSTILVVDDDQKTVDIISDYLNEAGYKTIKATSGKEALKLAEQYKPFAITLDIVMEDMDGWEVLQKLKNNIITRSIPVIIVSVSDDRDTGFALGAVGFIIKPVNKHVLISNIKKVKNMPDFVMIVDDNEFELTQISKIIEAEKIKTIRATSGKECIKLLNEKIPDILILDLMMPEMDGFTVLEKIRQKPETQNLPVIIVTAKDLSKEEQNRLSGNVSSLISKSEATPQHLLNEIKRIIFELEKSAEKNISEKTNHEVRILIVEDNPDAIIQVKTVLEREHYIVDVASGGQEAIDYVQNTIPNGIILDLMMPDIDGFEVLEKLRSTENTKLIPVIILTAKNLSQKELSKLRSNNIHQLIYKGEVDIEGLLLKVKLMLGNKPGVKEKVNIPDQILAIQKEGTINVKERQGKWENTLANVLIVEDNPDNMITIKAIINGKYNIIEAINGEEGLMLAQSQRPDLILLDMSLPKLGGRQIIRILRADEKTQNIPIIAVTAQAMSGDKEKIINTGADGYVAKPIDHENLLTEISRFLKE